MRRAPYVVVAASMAMLVGALLFPNTAYSDRGIVIVFGLFSFAWVFVGGLVSANRPENSVGWLILVTGTLMCFGSAIGQYGGYALLRDPSLPLAREAAWVTTWIFDPALCGIVLMLLVFPQGHLDGTVRRWTAGACVAASVVTTVAHMIVPSRMDGYGKVTNPFAVSQLTGLTRALLNIAGTVLAATFVVALISIVVRLRSARGNEREQLKWVVYAMVLIVVGLVSTTLPSLNDSWVGLAAVVLALLAVPVAIAVAILRHRLYDIDIVINRTLVYGALTAVLVATYLALVLGLRAVLTPLTGQSDLAVAASTLAVAALFRPLRNRIQTIVDQRFYRRRYDATLTLEAFAGRMRRQLDLEAVGADLRETVHGTVQPLSVSLWLRDAEGDR